MYRDRLDAPDLDEIEISVFGPGYGEAIAVHIGNGQWVLIDSCIAPGTNSPASLDYLTDLDVAVGEAVKLIVATHWHDDHIRGLGTLVKECEAAILAISSALRTREFSNLAAVFSGMAMDTTTGLDEFTKVISILDERRPPGARVPSLKYALSDRPLFVSEIQLPSTIAAVKVCSLSPSDASVLISQAGFANMMPQPGGQRRRLIDLSPNHTSVALWIEVGAHKILLGADLETTSDPTTGWVDVVNSGTVISQGAHAFKIPHHGSVNGHLDEVWDQLLSNEPFSIATPFRKGRHYLPTERDVARITGLTPNAYATAAPRLQQHRFSKRIVRDFVGQATVYMHNTSFGWGHVRLRKDIVSQANDWHVELFRDAYHL